MRRIIIVLSSIFLLSVLLMGCTSTNETGQNKLVDSEQPVEDVVFSDLELLQIESLEGKDNSLDPYSAVVNKSLKLSDGTKRVEGYMHACLGSEGGYLFKVNLLDNPKDNWEEIVSVNTKGETSSFRWDHSKSSQIWEVGPAAGSSNHINLMIKTVNHKSDYYCYVYDDEDTLLYDIKLDFMDTDSFDILDNVVLDSDGKIHVMKDVDGPVKDYMIFNADGSLQQCFHTDEYYLLKPIVLYDNSIGCLAEDIEMKDGTVDCYILQIENGVLKERLKVNKKVDLVSCFTLLNENTLLYSDNTGIYRSDIQRRNPELLYKWINHGIEPERVAELMPLQDGGIGVIYWTEGGDAHYLCLRETENQAGLEQITVLIPQGMKYQYTNAVAQFHKIYPSCHIELIDSYDDTVLNTELIAGKGPVLIDTALTGFESKKDLWEPLDKILKEMGLLDGVEMSAMELGKINGHYYGVIPYFYLETVVSKDAEDIGWNYKDFVEKMNSEKYRYLVNSGGVTANPLYFFRDFFLHDLNDNIFLDSDGVHTNLDTAEFRQLLRMVKEKCQDTEETKPDQYLESDTVLCNRLTIQEPVQLALYRMYYGDKVVYCGFPGKDGASTYVSGPTPLVIRKTASKKEKEIACAFIKLLLSYDNQMYMAKANIHGFCINSQALEEQMMLVTESQTAYAIGFEPITLKGCVDQKKDLETLRTLLSDAKPLRGLPGELSSIFIEELEDYFNGNISEDDAAKHLKNRVELYLQEQQ